ncbi:MAG: diguanylate cyclase [Chitinivibrionales bacterium]|nr:diguanylate cyclase [Chitinivibrionales bacterium]
MAENAYQKKNQQYLENTVTQDSYPLETGFVDRQDESALLNRFRVTGEKPALHVSGEAGVGKTRFIAEMKKQYNDEVLFIESACYETFERLYGPVITILAQCCCICSAELVKLYGPQLKKLLPFHERLKSIESHPPAEPLTERQILCKTIADFLLEFAQVSLTPIVFIIDDIQWIDDASSDVIKNLVYGAQAKNKLLGNRLKIITLGTHSISSEALKIIEKGNKNDNFLLFRGSETSREEGVYIRSLVDRSVMDYIELEPFSRDAIEPFFVSFFGEDKIGTSLLQCIEPLYSRIGGNPFLVQEVIRSLMATKAILRQQQVWDLVTPFETINLSLDIHTLLLERYRRSALNDMEQRLVETLSLLDRGCTIEELHWITGIDASALRRLVHLEMVRETRVAGQSYFSISHNLLRETIVHEIADPSIIHGTIAAGLEAIYGSEIEEHIDEVAHHYLAAENRDKAVLYLEQAIERAFKRCEMVHMAGLCDRLLGMYDSDDPKKIPVLLKKLEATQTFPTLDAMMAVSQELLRINQLHEDALSTARCHQLLGDAYVRVSRWVDSIECFEKALSAFQKMNDMSGIASVLNSIGVYYLQRDEFSKAIDFCKQSLEIAEAIADDANIGLSCGSLATVYERMGDYKAALNANNRALEIYEKSDDLHGQTIALVNIGSISAALDDREMAVRHIDKALAIADQIESPYTTVPYRLLKAEILVKLGDIDQAYELNQDTERFFMPELKATSDYRYRSKMILAQVLFARGEKQTAVELLTQLGGEFSEDACVAAIYKELWKMTGDEKQRTAALGLYKTLYVKHSRYSFKKCVWELENDVASLDDSCRFDGTPAAGSPEKRRPELSFQNLAKQLDAIHDIFKHNNLNVQFKLKETNELLYKQIAEIMKRFEGFSSSQTAAALVQYEQRRIVFLQQLLSIIHDLNSNYALDILLNKILDASITLLEADRGFILLLNKDNSLEFVAGRNKRKEMLDVKEIHIAQTVIQRVYDSQKALFVPDVADELDLSRHRSIIELELRSVMCAPLGRRQSNVALEKRRYPFLAASQKMGIIYLDNKNVTAESNFIDTNLNLFQALVDQASVAILNTMLYESVNIDKLTGLYLRSFFEMSCDLELASCVDNKSCLSILMLDVDFFKLINDRFGHQAGDEVLKLLGGVLKATLRTTDICGRYGGEEFVIILPNTDLEQAQFVGSKILKKIALTVFPCGTLTVSIGISSFPHHCRQFQKEGTRNKLFKNADMALYHAKRNGRNRWEVWNESIGLEQSVHTTAKDILTGNPIRDYRNVEMLLDVIKAVSYNLDTKVQLRYVIDLIVRSLDADRGMILLLNEELDELETFVARDKKGDVDSAIKCFNRRVVEDVFVTGKEVCMNGEPQERSERAADREGTSVLCVPLYQQAKRVGVIYVDGKREIKQFTTTELFFLNAIAVQISLLLQLLQKTTAVVEDSAD